MNDGLLGKASPVFPMLGVSELRAAHDHVLVASNDEKHGPWSGLTWACLLHCANRGEIHWDVFSETNSTKRDGQLTQDSLDDDEQ